MAAHLHHAHLRDGRLGHRGQHGSGHRCSRSLCIRALGVIEIDVVTSFKQGQAHEATHETGTQDDSVFGVGHGERDSARCAEV